MTDEEQIKKVFQDFEDGGLVSKDIHKVLRCVSDRIVGIGIGEQGFVRSKQEIKAIFESGLREDDCATYSLTYERLEIRVHNGQFANACGEICIHRMENGMVTNSKLLQTLIFIKEKEIWKICGLHASAPVITEENMEAYPLKVAEKWLRNLREEIGEKAYLAEEQFQQAILADTIAFYIINFSKNCFEKCQVNRELCAYVEPGTPYDKFIRDNVSDYVAETDREDFLTKLSLHSVVEIIAQNGKEIQCEYMLQHPNGTSLWAVTVIRLITDCITGEQKGIMYVKDIDKQKRREIEMKSRAECDDMTGFYNKTAFAREVEQKLSHSSGIPCALLMLDVDNFKAVNDTFGHPFGDRILTSAANILQEQFQENSILGRLGGDEFGIFIFGKSASDLAEECKKELMKKFRQIQIPDIPSFSVSCSIGIAAVQDICSFENLYQRADQALYRSKQNGKGCCTIYA